MNETNFEIDRDIEREGEDIIEEQNEIEEPEEPEDQNPFRTIKQVQCTNCDSYKQLALGYIENRMFFYCEACGLIGSLLISSSGDISIDRETKTPPDYTG